MFLWPYIVSRRSAKRMMEQQQVLAQNNSMERVVRFFDQLSELARSDQELRFQYGQITRFFETSSLYCLFLGKALCILVKKDSFTIGDPDEFKPFLRTKCPQLKIK